MSEAFEMGLSRGWDAANYGEAYRAPIGTTDTPPAYAEPAGDYQDGYTEGVNRFLADQYQDGSPMDLGD